MSDKNGNERRGFHFNKEVSLGHVLQLIVIVGSLLVVARDFDNRLVILEQYRVYSDKTMAEIKDTLKSIDRKLTPSRVGHAQ